MLYTLYIITLYCCLYSYSRRWFEGSLNERIFRLWRAYIIEDARIGFIIGIEFYVHWIDCRRWIGNPGFCERCRSHQTGLQFFLHAFSLTRRVYYGRSFPRISHYGIYIFFVFPKLHLTNDSKINSIWYLKSVKLFLFFKYNSSKRHVYICTCNNKLNEKIISNNYIQFVSKK